MNPADNDDQDRGASATQQGPGSLLKKARERQGLSAAAVAAQLHLQTDTIDSLERDDYDTLPGPVFVQGYLRNYARLLGLKEAAVVAAYQRLFPDLEEQNILSSADHREGKPMHSSHGVMRLVTWSIVIVLAVLLFFWWQTRANLEPPESYPISQESLQEELPEAELPADPENQLDGMSIESIDTSLADDPVLQEMEVTVAPQAGSIETPLVEEVRPEQVESPLPGASQ
jgi:cytoskeleton protein RodZ